MSSHMLVVGFVTVCSLGWFDNSGGADVLSLSSYVSLLCLFRPRVKFDDNLNIDEWPGEIVSMSDGFEPHVFFGIPAAA